MRTSNSHHSSFVVAALIAASSAGCVGEIEDLDEGFDEELGDGLEAEEELVESGAPEVVEPGRADEAVDETSLAAGTAHHWTLTIVSGKVSSGDGLADYDDGNPPDMYVKRLCGGVYRNKTAVAWNTAFPRWGTKLVDSYQSDAYIKSCVLEPWDWDEGGYHYRAGTIRLGPIVDAMNQQGVNSILVTKHAVMDENYPNWDSTNVTIVLRRL